MKNTLLCFTLYLAIVLASFCFTETAFSQSSKPTDKQLDASTKGSRVLKSSAEIKIPEHTPPANRSIQIRRIDPAGCIKPGQQFRITGINFLITERLQVILRGNNRVFEITPEHRNNASLTLSLPSDAGFSAGQQYQVGLKTTKGSIWPNNPSYYINLCRNTTRNILNDETQKLSIPKNNLRTPSGTTANVKINSATDRTDTIIITSDEDSPEGTQTPITPTTVPPAITNQNINQDTNQSTNQDTNQNTNQSTDNGTLTTRPLPPAPVLPQITSAQLPADSIEPEQIVIVTANLERAVTLANQLTQYGLRIKTRQTLENLGIVLNVFRLPAGSSVVDTINQLRNELSNDIWIDSNLRYQLLGGNSKRYGQTMVAYPPCMAPLRLGMIDTAVWQGHSALRNAKITQHNVIDRGETPAPPDHGTTIAGLLVGSDTHPQFTGLLPKAELYVANVFRKAGKNKETNVEWLLLGLDWLLQQNLDAINLSIGGQHNIIVELAIKRLLQQDLALVAAAGNGGPKAAPVYPAAFSGVIAVTALDTRQQLYKKANQGDYISFAAPGVDIWSANTKGKGFYQSGTSFATPFVTAIAAIQRHKNPQDKRWQDALQKSAIDLGKPGKDSQYGWGLLQLKQDCQKN